MSGPRVVAIDGAAGAGKSTLARALARRLGLPYVNTGEMYRAVAAAALRDGVESGDEDALLGLARALRFTLGRDEPVELEVEGWSRDALHTSDVESTVSAVAAHPRVREVLREEQRRLARGGAVMEGRDIGAVVVPDAAVKLFVRADAETRARRRAAERVSERAGHVADALRTRDRRDARTNRLEPAAGAEVIDTTDLEPVEAVEAAVAVVRRLAPELLL